MQQLQFVRSNCLLAGCTLFAQAERHTCEQIQVGDKKADLDKHGLGPHAQKRDLWVSAYKDRR